MPEQVFERIERLLNDRGKSQHVVLGMNRSTYSNWLKLPIAKMGLAP